jgi:hypothetical protein
MSSPRIRNSEGEIVIGKPIALIQVPAQRLFKVQAAARYLGISDDTLKKYTALGLVKAHDLNGSRVYKLEDLDRLIDCLLEWDDARGEKPAKVMEGSAHDL